MRRVTIKWDLRDYYPGQLAFQKLGKVNGVVTLSDFGSSPLAEPKTSSCICGVATHSVGMSRSSRGRTIVPLTGEEIKMVNALMTWYFAGLNREPETYVWLPDKKERKAK